MAAGVYWLSSADLRALATGDGQAEVVRRLRAAELSKHKLLLAALMREAQQSRPSEYAATLVPAYRLLADVQAHHPEVVDDLLISPQFGGWVSDCVRRLSASEQAIDAAPLATDLGQLAIVAAAAALQAHHPFDLDVPLRHGVVTFPDVGTASLGGATVWDWGHASLGARGGRIASSISAVSITAAPDASSLDDESWSGIPRLTASADGVRFDAVLDDRDPFLDRYGTARVAVTNADLLAWQAVLDRAWPILTGGHHELATMIATVVRTLVPLARPTQPRSISSTAASCFGAVALSLPTDALTMAEALVHEFQHGVLSAVMDLMPMVNSGADILAYAPWREDARPVGTLLQGVYAHYGIGTFWRLQRSSGTPAERLRANVEFARWRMLVTETTELLDASGVLAGPGRVLVSAIRGLLATWRNDGVPSVAIGYAEDLSVDHRVRWRLRHLTPDAAAIDSLTSAWRLGVEPAQSAQEINVRLDHGSTSASTSNFRTNLLVLRHQDPDRFRWLAERGFSPAGSDGAEPRIDAADVALLAEAYTVAAEGYVDRIQTGEDVEAWVGLAIARRHTGPATSARTLARRPEIVVALFNRLKDGQQVDPDGLTRWLTGQ
jgi:HEXXH motif-containing protein